MAAGILFTAQLFTTFAMTGLIWFVQLVHYPLFALVPDPHHSAYAAHHQRRTGWVVAPLMLIELLTAFLSLWPRFRPPQMTTLFAASGFTLVAIIWISTALLQIPIHNRLSHSAEAGSIQRLVTTNWIRTIAWTARSILLLSTLLSVVVPPLARVNTGFITM